MTVIVFNLFYLVHLLIGRGLVLFLKNKLKFKVEFNNLRDALNYEYHNNINPNEVRVVKLGEAILKVMNTVLTSKKYSGQTKSDLKDIIKKTNSILKPFKNSLISNSKN